MDKTLNALGLMSGTSMDGIDASLIISDGENNIDLRGNLFLKYDSELKRSLYDLCTKINSLKDLSIHIDEYKNIERKITIKHSEIASNICEKFKFNPDIIGFHGQTILHRPQEKFSIQMGNANLLSQLLKKDVIYEFRKKDINNGGEGAPLTPIYHHSLKKKLKLSSPVMFLNIGGISNFTFSNTKYFTAKDVGPGNCLMDLYTRTTKNIDFDKDGMLAETGKIDNVLINNILDQEYYSSNLKHSFDIKDFNLNMVKGLTTEDALANLNFLTAKMIAENIKEKLTDDLLIILCGGGRKNKTLVKNLKKLINNNIHKIDDYDIDGDFIESQAFGYLAIRSILNKNISFPETTKVRKPISGGEFVKFI